MKNKILLYLCIGLFAAAGVYLTFFRGNTSKFDSQTKAYRIYPNESSDSDGVTYAPIYYYSVNGNEYECTTKVGSSSYPDDSKNIVYYDSKNPEKCMTQYEASTGRFGGIICLIATAIMVYFFIIKKPSSDSSSYNEEASRNYQADPEQAEKALKIVEKVQLIYKRVILGIIIMVLLVFVLIETAIFRQTIKARDYIETTATYVDKKSESESSVFDDYVYTFKDKLGNSQEIIVSASKDSTIKDEIKIKYNEENPQDYYEEGSTMDKSGIIWYVVKVILLILLIVLFFNKKILNKINIFASASRN